MQFLRWLLRLKVRWSICWLIFLFAAGFVAMEAAKAFNDAHRGDGNYGHTTIDFGGQWLMGRMIVEGQGRHLYSRNSLRRLAARNYPAGVENPKAEKTDAENFMEWMAGSDDRKAPQVLASLLSPLAAGSPLEEAVILASVQTVWTDDYLEHATGERIGGALYPPIHALYYAPLALLRPPLAYRIMQGLILFLALFAGWVAQRMTEGRVWWPVASLFIFLFPSYSACISLGQNGIFILTLVLLGWWQLMRGREVLAGLCWGLLAFKPVWAVALLLVPLLTARWRMAASMAGAGILQIALTLPIVGWESWHNWLQVGQSATQEYKRQENWIFLSRDVQGIPRRWLLTFEDGLAKDVVWRKSDFSLTVEGADEKRWDNPLLSLVCWGVWSVVLAITVWVAWRCRQRRGELIGPFPAFVLSGAILTCYHFMYYDFLAAGVPVLLLFTEPRRFFQLHFWRKRSEPRPLGSGDDSPEIRSYYQPSLEDLMPPPMPLLPDGRQPRWVIAPIPPLLLTLMLALPAISCILDPSFHFPPWETFVLLLLWAWCGYRLLLPSRDRKGAVSVQPLPYGRGSEESRIHAAQFAELGADVRGAHERLADQHGTDSGRL